MLERPLDQRVREHKYRCAQAIIFGLPVLGLQYFGHQLGGPESGRWVAIMQVVLTGWILFVAATGMISEGVMLIVAHKRLSADLLIATIAVAIFLFSCITSATSGPRAFHIVVIVLAGWGFIQWQRARLMLGSLNAAAGRSTRSGSGSAAESEA